MKKIWRNIIFCLMVAVIFLMPISAMKNYEKNSLPNAKQDFTHTVLAEYSTATWCPACRYAHATLKNIYEKGWFPFYYVSFVFDKNTRASSRLEEYNVYYIPFVAFDGGYKVNVGAEAGGATQDEYNESIIASGNLPVWNIDASLSVAWLGNATMDIKVTVQNNEALDYDGHLRVYVTEITSARGWRDHGGNLYTFAFLDYAFNQQIHVGAKGAWQDSVVWDGNEHTDGYGNDFGNISQDNIMVIAAVFNPTCHQGYAVPPNENPFDAYYVDETVADVPTKNSPPISPTIEGPTTGKAGTEYEYTFVSTDPDGDDVYYYIDWGDGTNSSWIGPYNPGEEISLSHAWNEKGTYVISAKCKDSNDVESDWNTLEISMPKTFHSITPLLERINEWLWQIFEEMFPSFNT